MERHGQRRDCWLPVLRGVQRSYREIRARLSTMAPRRAVAWIRSIELTPEEERAVIDIDVRRRSRAQVAWELCVSVDGLSKIRRRAYGKILDADSAALD